VPLRDVGIELAEAKRCYLMAPAGYGKTHSIALAVKEAVAIQGKQLILTHTHAGVHSLNSKLSKLGVPRAAFNVETIAGWALKYAAAFPAVSGMSDLQPSGKGWENVYPSALSCLKVPPILAILMATYGGVFVDEYQDCTRAQHDLILYIADHLPCRILGDPLQGVFEFEGSTIDFNSDLSSFSQLEPLSTPYRWINAGAAGLGDWLQDVRQKVDRLEPIDLTAPVQYIPLDSRALNSKCIGLYHGSGTVLVVHKVDNQAHSFSKGIGGKFRSMEEMDCKRLMQFACAVDEGDAVAQARALIAFTLAITSNASAAISHLDQALARDRHIEATRYRANAGLAQSIQNIVDGGGPSAMLAAYQTILNLDGVTSYRVELKHEGRRCLTAMTSGKHENYTAAAFAVRDLTRRIGRRSERFVSSRVLLVKGLEYDHAVVANAESLTPKELYVALTRGSQTLLVQSGSTRISFQLTPRKPKKVEPVRVEQFDLFSEPYYGR